MEEHDMMSPVDKSLQQNPTFSYPKSRGRIRRKDASCDRCRKRKVRCDATNSKECSQCISRNITCCFSAEKDQRPSSDIIAQLKQTIAQLRDENEALRQMLGEQSRAATSTPDEDLCSSGPKEFLQANHTYAQEGRNFDKLCIKYLIS